MVLRNIAAGIAPGIKRYMGNIAPHTSIGDFICREFVVAVIRPNWNGLANPIDCPIMRSMVNIPERQVFPVCNNRKHAVPHCLPAHGTESHIPGGYKR